MLFIKCSNLHKRQHFNFTSNCPSVSPTSEYPLHFQVQFLQDGLEQQNLINNGQLHKPVGHYLISISLLSMTHRTEEVLKPF